MCTCDEYRPAVCGGLIPCNSKAIRAITYQDNGGCTEGNYCSRHAIALRRAEVQGVIEILSDEPLPLPYIPFKGEQVDSPVERTPEEMYGLVNS